MTTADPIAAYSTAKGYVQSAYLLMTNPARYQVPDDTSFFLSFHMLCGFAVELYLKSFLSKSGYEEKALRGANLRHDLSRLLQEAEANGFSETSAKWLIDLFSDHHKSFEFRYMKPTSKYTTADLRLIFSALSNLDRAIDGTIAASAAHGKMPGRGWVFPEGAAWRL